jgi:hypothetical protein
MDNNKLKKATSLFDEIGNIGEVYLEEALTYRKRRVNTRPWIAAVACILVVVLVGGGLLRSPLLNNIFGAKGEAENPAPESPKPIPQIATLDGYLTQNRETLNSTKVLVNDLSYFGSTYLVWQYEGDETLRRSRDLTVREVDHILGLMGQGDAVGTSSPDLMCRVWLVCEDGTVLSPYLKNTDGNKGFAILFDYEAEILPSSYLISCISDILN